MDTAFAVLMLVTAAGTFAYWVDFFLHGAVHVVEEDWYIKFERSFPVADSFMAVSATIGGIGLLLDDSFGVGWTLVAGACMIFLALMDITFNVDNNLYRYLSTSQPMRAELFLNVWLLGFGIALLAAYL